MSNSPGEPAWRTAKEIADEIGVEPATVRRWAREGDIRLIVRPLPKRGRRYAIREADDAPQEGAA